LSTTPLKLKCEELLVEVTGQWTRCSDRRERVKWIWCRVKWVWCDETAWWIIRSRFSCVWWNVSSFEQAWSILFCQFWHRFRAFYRPSKN